VRLVEVAGDLGDQPVGTDADGDDDARARLHLLDQLPQGRERTLELRDVGVALVEPDHLQEGQLLAHEAPHLLGLGAVGGEVGGYEDGIGAQAPRA
jgi:hypothetical protein